MKWGLGLVGAVLGAAFAELGGAAAGFAIGWLFGAMSELRTRLDRLERAAELRPVAAVAHAPPTAVPVAPRAADDASLVDAPSASVAAPIVAPEAVARGAVAPDAVASDAAAPAPLRVERDAASVFRDGRPPAPAMPRPPRAPDWAERLAGSIKGWFTEGNVPVKIGMLVLFFGVAAALKYAVDQGLVTLPIELRLALVAAAAIAGLGFGWRHRNTRPAFALSLQGGAIGVLLLTTFAAYRLYGLLPPLAAFSLVVVIVAGAALLALLQDAAALAVLGFTGGYVAPVLISTGSGDHVALFTWYALLNAAVFAIAWKRPWRALNLVGFAFTFAIGVLWGAKYYRAEHFATVEPFLVLFFVFYLAIPVLYALRQPVARRGFVDGTLVFGMPLLAFPLQAAMLEDDRMGLAYSALVVAAVYAALTAWLLRRPATRLLGQSFALLAVGFATLAVPLALSARWTATTWAIEGVALVWLGLRQDRLLPQATGLVLQLLAAVAYVVALFDAGFSPDETALPVLNGEFLGAAVLALAGYATSYLYDRADAKRALVWLTFLGASFWWCVGGLYEIERLDPGFEPLASLLWFLAATAAIAAVLRRALGWQMLGWPIAAAVLLGIPLALATHARLGRPLAHPAGFGWLAWFAAGAFGAYVLRGESFRRAAATHIALLATLALVAGLELRALALSLEPPLGEGWTLAAFGLPLALLLSATWRTRAARWPLADGFERHAKAWYALAGTALAGLWTLSLWSDGDTAPLVFVPLLNPLELAQLAVLALLALLARDELALERDVLGMLAGGAAFVFITVASLRAVHHLAGLPWDATLLDSRLAQAVLTITWSVLGVVAWVYGSKRRRRGVWLAGAVLMGVVLAKLGFVDRQYVGNLAGIVTFLAVGLLLTAVGWFAPSPPREPPVEAVA
ncbi:MAG TPA: DUF2339 domain-containing protein [Candidatus Saccharimonadia bacterium]|nr:DUF2339 domain-containing protein [Candidatus Saccharimonadia bacterium]